MNDVAQGQAYPLGATVHPDGVNFSVFSKRCAALELLLFDGPEDARPARVIELDPAHDHRTFYYWHAFVPGVEEGQIYGYRAYGPHDPERGLRYDSGKVLLDPYGRSVAVPRGYDREAASLPGDNAATAMKSVVADLSAYDWEGDTPPKRRFARTVVYEMHVGGFTRHPSSGVPARKRGTYLGLIEKIPYLLELGVTAVELLPVFQFDPQEAPPGLSNYWGYNPVSFFAPHSGYSSSRNPVRALDEFRDMVKALHRAGIEVILDVVYNHTAEGNESGPTFCFRGLDNIDYYFLDPNDKARYVDYAGTGNALNANHAIVRRLILDSLRYWVKEMHVDGFRFDLASILSRDVEGRPVANPPVLWDIETDPILSGTKLIAEAWDAAGLYQVGSFFGDHWKEWNGRFRDDVRSFLRGDEGYVKELAARFLASPDIYGHREREPEQSINFVTCHDGFTLNDLVSYNEKHNSANQEEDRDGRDDNRSWNCGVEGDTDEPGVEKLRARQIKNFFSINLLALGVPMISMGDEVRRTQRGNNNPYCHDSELTWFDWSLVDKHRDLHRFVRKLVHFRSNLPLDDHGLSLTEVLRLTPVQWHGVKLNEPDFSHNSHSLALTFNGLGHWWHLMVNAYTEPLQFELPVLPAKKASRWRQLIDTYKESPEDFHDLPTAPFVGDPQYLIPPHSLALLVAQHKRG
ncbi:MAG: glycogen debranching protein GlgX [Myxococcales bacterium]|nr:glycogen debranching protein GlgX [Myxococcales bacterium]